MHILYFHQHFSTPRGAAGIRSYEMARSLIAHGHKVTMVCGSYKLGETGLEGSFHKGIRRGLVDGIAVIEFDLSYSNGDSLLRRSWTFLKFALGSVVVALRSDYDILFATTTPLTAGIPGIAARWLRRKTFVFEVRDLWPELPKQMGVIRNPVTLGLLSALEWVSYRSAQRCVALSPGIAEGIARQGVREQDILMVPNGCDIGIFGSADVAPQRPPTVSADDFVAIFAGTHGQANGLDAVLDAAAVLKARNRSDIKLFLVGDGKFKPQLVARAERDGLTKVIFHAPVNKKALAQLLAGSDLGLQCLANIPAFYFGTSPNKFFDYIAAGKPVLCNYPGWLAEMIEGEECGFAVPPDQPSAFADALEAAAADRPNLTRMGQNASRLAETQFDRQLLADRWVAWVVSGQKT
jgi:glycosyltransferase involved in cell wall biosynthesis